MDDNRERMLREVMAADFTLIDLNLYLNTHPDDCRTVQLYNSCAQRARLIRENYERLYGPLSLFATCIKCPWQWIENPWPWHRQ
jgi:spore coat protein JB